MREKQKNQTGSPSISWTCKKKKEKRRQHKNTICRKRKEGRKHPPPAQPDPLDCVSDVERQGECQNHLQFFARKVLFSVPPRIQPLVLVDIKDVKSQLIRGD